MKAIVCSLVMLLNGICIAGPHRCPPPHHGSPHHGPRHCPPPPHHHSHWHNNDYFWSGFAGGVIGGLLSTTIRPEPTVVVSPAVVTTPVVVQQPTVVQPVPVIQNSNAPKQVWIEGHYESRVQANGIIMNVWIPGHYVTVQ